MLRISPSFAPLWRTPTSLQLGVDGAVRLESVSPWQERLLAALQGGIPDAMFAPLAESLGATAPEADEFARTIRPALSPPPRESLVVTLEVPADFGYAPTTALVDALRACEIHVEEVRSWPESGPGTPVILVGHHLVDPRRAAHLVASDVTHLPVELSGDRVSVGPLVVPGSTACLACVHAHRRDADPAWPQVAAQLVGRGPTVMDPCLMLEVGLITNRLLRTPLAESTASASVSSADLRRAWRDHRPHPQCLCRSPAGSASAGARDVPSSVTTTATAYARPA
jgi:hypothetical protein